MLPLLLSCYNHPSTPLRLTIGKIPPILHDKLSRPVINLTYRKAQAMCGYPLREYLRTLGKGLLRTPLHPHGKKTLPAAGRKGLLVPL